MIVFRFLSSVSLAARSAYLRTTHTRAREGGAVCEAHGGRPGGAEGRLGGGSVSGDHVQGGQVGKRRRSRVS